MNFILRDCCGIFEVTLRSWKIYPVLLAAALLLSYNGGGQEIAQDTLTANSPRRNITLLAVGDVNLGRNCGQSIIEEGPQYPFAHLRDWIESYDLAFCNLESTISDQGGETVKPNNRLIFTAPPGAETALATGGWDFVATANNHCNDYGISALEETIHRLNAAHIACNGTALERAGLYKPTYLYAGGYCIAFFAVTDIMNGPVEGTNLEDHLNWADRDALLPNLQEAHKRADFIILSYHGGVEYTPVPTRETVDFLHWAVDSGVDIVIGHHPHFFQGVEWYNNGLIIYSLGNFTFYQNGWMYWTDYGLAAVITLGDGGIAGLQFIPIRANYQAQVIEDAALKDKILNRLIKLSGNDPTVINVARHSDAGNIY